jgi:putative RNA 2'-phosphotransferase
MNEDDPVADRPGAHRGEHLGKLLALVLRHRPDVAGVTLDPAGWVDVDELVAGLRRTGRRITADDVRAAVAADSKGRYELADGRVRAAQGHSVAVELGLEPLVPPAVLYHGTVQRFVPSILAAGLRPGSRQFVHLSPDVETALAVGRRRGAPVVLAVDAAGAAGAGHEFRRASNGVWLTDAVPPAYVRVLS